MELMNIVYEQDWEFARETSDWMWFFFFDNDWLNVISEDYRSSIWRWLRNWKTNIASYAINGNLGSNKGLFYELHVIDEEHVSIIQSINMLRS